MRLLLPLLASGAALSAQAGPATATEEPVIRSVTLRPGTPVVGPAGSLRLVIDVVARGAAGPGAVTVRVEPGTPPAGGTVLRPEPLPPTVQQWGTPIPAHAVFSRPAVPRALAVRRTGGGRRTQAARVAAVPPAPVVPGASAGSGVLTALAVPGAPGALAEPAAEAGGGWETWRFLPDKQLNRWYPAGPWMVIATARGADGASATGYARFELKRATRFSSIEAVREGRDVKVTGVLNRVDPQGYLDYAPFPGQPVEILHREEGQTSWTTAASATTDRQGRFTRRMPGAARGGGGDWRIRYAGTSGHAPRLSVIHPTGGR
ncbi:hypothetical protein GCM10010140_52840 [Streptosporangium pseudovulgare]|uniref:Macroglobulin domain-containing protein n=2 Tax=Streptosporangium pseudovulgare TaxID=35765 RepID=A0ABQ2R9N7_9ACTN|nr:hypothetical protein GCM10010140_52840 [Streptosporangium pseudovulgare]